MYLKISVALHVEKEEMWINQMRILFILAFSAFA